MATRNLGEGLESPEDHRATFDPFRFFRIREGHGFLRPPIISSTQPPLRRTFK